MTENTGRRIFQEDIFADDNNGKWSWPLGRTSNISSVNVSNYDIHAGGDKCSSSSPSSDEDALFKGDSTDSLKRSFRKHGSSSASEGNLPEDGSSSSGAPRRTIPHERVLPSIYDDDAQSGNPSDFFEKKDLAFQSSFGSLQNQTFESNLLLSEKAAVENQNEFSKEHAKNQASFFHLSPKRDSKDKSVKLSPSNRRRSRSRDGRGHSRSRSRSKERRIRSPRRENHKSRSQDRLSERSKYSKSRRSRSPRSRRSRSPKSVRSRSPRSSRSRDSRRRSRSKDSRRRSRSYDRRRRNRRSSSRDRYRRRRSRSRSYSRERSRGSGMRKPGSLPLSTSGGAMTPQMALQQTMAAMSAKAQAMTGIALPKYYNPAAVNPLKYAEQVQKRKLLWQNKEKEVEQPKNTVWDKLTFDQDQDGKMTAKFRKLMGIKSDGAADEPEVKESVLKKQAELFRDLDQQYEMARVTTHTQRGVGLGYSAATLYPPVQK